MRRRRKPGFTLTYPDKKNYIGLVGQPYWGPLNNENICGKDRGWPHQTYSGKEDVR